MGSTANDSLNMEIQDNSDKRNDEEVEDLEWSADQEILLLYSLHGYKPVGPNKHFRMLLIQERLSNAMNKNISSKAIWKKLNTLYDLEALDEAEAEADAMVAVEIDFVLPEDEYGELMAKKLKKNVIKAEKLDLDSDENSDTQGPDMLSEFKTELESSSVDNEAGTSRDAGDTRAGGVKDNRKETPKRGFKKKETTGVKDLHLKRDTAKETPKKDTPGKKEVAKEAKKGTIKEEDKKDMSKKFSQEVGKSAKETRDNKEEKKESPIKIKGAEKKTEQTKKEMEVKKTEPKKVGETPKNQRAEAAKPRAETPKQLRTETPKRTEAKTLRSETPKPQRVEILKKESSVDKKKEIVDKKTERRSPEKTPDTIRGAKLRTRERKDLEPEKPETATSTKRERSRDSTSKTTDNTSEELTTKKTKTPVVKGRPTRNSVEPQQKATSPAVNTASPQKRRRVL